MSISNKTAFGIMRLAFALPWVLLSTTILLAQEEPKEAPRRASGYNNPRLEQEDRYVVPPEQAEEVWKYLVDTYVDNTTRLQALDPQFTSYFYDEDFTDTYFDTPRLEALATECGIRYRVRYNITNPDDVKSGRQLLQIKSSGVTGNALERGEIKFPINPRENIKVAEDKHPMLGLVKPEYRVQLKEYLRERNLDASAMKPILTIKDYRRRLYIKQDGKPFMSISLDIGTSKKLWCTSTVIEVEPELNEIVFTEADDATRRYMEGISAKIVADLRQQFPALTRDLSPKYNRMFQQFEAEIPYLRSAIGLSDEAIAAILAGILVGGIGITWLVHRVRRWRQESLEQWQNIPRSKEKRRLADNPNPVAV